MVRQHHSDDFDAWIRDVQHTGVKELRAFAKGLLKDEAAVRAGLSLVWSNGPTEGFIHRLNLVKQQAYGRAGGDFLRHRILTPSARAAAQCLVRRRRVMAARQVWAEGMGQARGL
jgi:transposase